MKTNLTKTQIFKLLLIIMISEDLNLLNLINDLFDFPETFNSLKLKNNQQLNKKIITLMNLEFSNEECNLLNIIYQQTILTYSELNNKLNFNIKYCGLLQLP